MSYSIRVYNSITSAQGLNVGVKNIHYIVYGQSSVDVPYGQDSTYTGFTGTATFTATFDQGYAFYRWAYNIGGTTEYSYDNPFEYKDQRDIQIRCESQIAPIYYGKVDYYLDGVYWTSDVKQGESADGGVYLDFIATSAPYKEGYNFLGWSVNYGASSPDYYVGQTITVYATSTNPNDPTSLTLYSVYERAEDTYYAKVQYDAGIGSNPPPSQTSSQSATSPPTISFTVSAQEPIAPTGYKFVNWQCQEDGQTYESGSTISFTATSQDQSNPTTRHLVAQYVTLGSLYLYTDIGALSKRFMLGIPYTYNGSTWEPYTAELEHLGRFLQGVP